jgi:hypothetical protein
VSRAATVGREVDKLRAQNMIGHSLRSAEHDVHAKSHAPRCTAMTANAQKLSAFRIRKTQLGSGGQQRTSVCTQLDY